MAKVELVFVPTTATGHLVSTVELAKLIVKHNPQISILVLIFHMPIFNSKPIDAYIESQSRQVDPNRITFVTLPPLSNPPDPASSNFFYDIIDLQKPLIKQALADRSIKPVAFVLDHMCVNLIDVVKEFQVPSYIYFSAGVSMLTFMFHIQQLVDDKGFDISSEYNVHSGAELELPGFRNRVPVKVLPGLLFEKGSWWSKLIYHLSRRFRETKGILVNTFMELESGFIQSLLKHENIPAVYPVGPIVALDENIGGARDEDRDLIMQWLDEQPSSSVVFLCFGSMGSFGVEQVKEIANGLEQSGARFLWALRRPVSENSYVVPSDNEAFEEALPQGFLTRTAHRGKIIAWAPQVQVLGHRAVGGFVSHCGWNSIMESLWFGVPIATWPMYSEQNLNAFEMVKELGLAVEIRMDYQRILTNKDANIIVTAKEVENGVNKLMNMDEAMKVRIQEMRNKSRQVLESGGSSHAWLTRFITQVLDGDILN